MRAQFEALMTSTQVGTVQHNHEAGNQEVVERLFAQIDQVKEIYWLILGPLQLILGVLF